MSVIGIGVDLVEISRIRALIEKHANHFLDRMYTEEEQQFCKRLREPCACYAARFAAKEAISKALGTGIGPACGWLEMEIQRLPSGSPQVALTGAAALTAQKLGIKRVLLSLTHTADHAMAYAMAVSE